MRTRINIVMLHLFAFYAAFKFLRCASDAVLLPFGASGSTAAGSSATVFFQVTGNVYPNGHYYVKMAIGNPPNPYFLDIDTGSDLTWVQCDAPCINCLPAPHPPYKPSKNLVKCNDPLCVAFHWPTTPDCTSPDQCDYDIAYADKGETFGVLVKDRFPLRYSNGTVTAPSLAFGCGYDQNANGETPPYLDGVLGLGFGKVGVLNQLQELGVTKNVVGHCFSSKGDGYLFFGDQLVMATWIPYRDNKNGHYSLGTAEVFVGAITSGMKGLPVAFDSGSTYTYFSRNAYRVIVSLLMNDIKGKQLNKADNDNTLPICLKGLKPFNSVQDVINLFKPIVLTFENSNNVRFQMDPQGYLIISEKGNACLGILDGTEAGLGGLNVIGDISFQDKLVIYDNVRKQIGWAPANCNNIPK